MFFARKRLQAGRLSTKAGRWSLHYAGAVRNWARHLLNADFENYWCAHINTYLSHADLELLRMANSRGSKRDRTNTRSQQGHVHLRWHDGLNVAKGVACLKPVICTNTRFFGY